MNKCDLIQIRVRPGGRIYVDGLCEPLLEVALALCPDDPALKRRAQALAASRATQSPERTPGHEHAKTSE